MKRLYKIEYESYGLNGDNPEGVSVVVNVIATSIEKAIKKLRSSLSKSIEYEIIGVYYDEDEVIE